MLPGAKKKAQFSPPNEFHADADMQHPDLLCYSGLYASEPAEPPYHPPAAPAPAPAQDAPEGLTAVAHELAHFDMFVQDKSGSPSRILHRITALRRGGARDRDTAVPNAALLQTLLPGLWAAWTRRDGGPPGAAPAQIVHARATLDLWAAPIPKGAELGIQFEVRTHAARCDLAAHEAFECRTAFWADGEEVHSNRDAAPERRRVDIEAGALGNVGFCSDFWAGRVVRLGARLREAAGWRKRAGAGGAGDALLARAKALELEVRADVERLSAVQEISARAAGGAEDSRATLLVVHWAFAQARPGQPPEVSWSHVVLPGSGAPSSALKLDGPGLAALDAWNAGVDAAGSQASFTPSSGSGSTLLSSFDSLPAEAAALFDVGALAALPAFANTVDFAGGAIELTFDAGGAGPDDAVPLTHPASFAHHQPPLLYAPQPQHPGAHQWHSAYSQGPYFAMEDFGGVEHRDGVHGGCVSAEGLGALERFAREGDDENRGQTIAFEGIAGGGEFVESAGV